MGDSIALAIQHQSWTDGYAGRNRYSVKFKHRVPSPRKFTTTGVPRARRARLTSGVKRRWRRKSIIFVRVVWLAGKKFESMIQTSSFDRYQASAAQQHSPRFHAAKTNGYRAINIREDARNRTGSFSRQAAAIPPTIKSPADNRHCQLATLTANLCQ